MATHEQHIANTPWRLTLLWISADQPFPTRIAYKEGNGERGERIPASPTRSERVQRLSTVTSERIKRVYTESGYTTFAPESVYSVVQRKIRKDHNNIVRVRKEADRIVEILKLAAAGSDSLLHTVRPEQLHQTLLNRNADPAFVQSAIKQCDLDGESPTPKFMK